MPNIRIDMSRIVDRETFHDVFAEALGFPAYYGRNMSAWIDCLTYVDDPVANMVSDAVVVPACDVLALQLDDVDAFARGCPNLYEEMLECAAFVNWRRTEAGDRPIVALSFNRHRDN